MNHSYPIIPDILLILFIIACIVKATEKPETEIEVVVAKEVKPPKEKSRLWFYKDRHGRIHKEVKI